MNRTPPPYPRHLRLDRAAAPLTALPADAWRRFDQAMNAPAPRPHAPADLARLCLAAYDETGAPPGWSRLEARAGELRALGLEPGLFRDEDSGFAAALFRPDGRDGDHVLAFRGSDEVRDYVKANIPQSMGLPSPQYRQAMDLAALAARALDGRLTLTGHSLGGGLAAAASAAAGVPAVTFNAAGLHPRTLDREGLAPDKSPSRVSNHHFSQEALSWSQNNPAVDVLAAALATPAKYAAGLLGAARGTAAGFDPGPAYLPRAAGRQLALTPQAPRDPTAVAAPVARCRLRAESFELHGLDRVLAALEAGGDGGGPMPPAPPPYCPGHR